MGYGEEGNNNATFNKKIKMQWSNKNIYIVMKAKLIF